MNASGDTAVIRLVSFNVLHGAALGPDGRADRVDPDRFAAAIRRLDPDVLALQEVDHHQPRSAGLDLTRIDDEAMGAVASSFLPVLPGLLGEGPGDRSADAGYGLALLSRFPALDWQRLRLPRLATGYPGWDRRPVPRPVRRTDERRGALLGRFATPLGELTVIDTHLSFVPGPREAQLLRLRRRLRGIDGPLVLMGDLNLAAPWPARLLGLTPLADRPTFPNDHPRTQIDHVLARGRWTVHAAEALDAGLSDHRALVVEATFAP